MSLTIGVDPGLTGAIAILDSYGELVNVHDMPVVDKQVSPRLVAGIVTDAGYFDDSDVYANPVAVVEQVHSMPKQGVASSFKFGQSYGIVLGVLAASAIHVEHVTPSRWKRDMHLTADKELSRRRAIDRWPSRSDWFKLKVAPKPQIQGRAEAALIALWYIERGSS